MTNSPAIASDRTVEGAFPDQMAQSTDSMHVPVLLQYWQMVLRRKWVIVGVTLVAVLAGLVATLLMTPQYSAHSRIEISRAQKNITKVEGVETQDETRDDLEFYQTQYALLEARSLAERVSQQMRLATSDRFFDAHGVSPNSLSEFFGAGGASGQMSAEARRERDRKAVELLLDHISISPVRGSSLVDISYRSASPELSAEIANMWTQQFIGSSMDRRFASTADARRFLEGRLADLRTRLEQSERDVVSYASNKGIVTISKTQSSDGKTQGERTLAAADLEALNDALAKATADRVSAESKVRVGGGRGASSEALSNTAISLIRQKRAEVAADYAKVLVQFEPGYPAARALHEQLRELDISIAREENRVLSTRSSEYREALQREQQLRDKVEALKSRLDLQQRDSIQYNIYQREADTNRQLYDALLQRYKEIGVAGVGANNIAIVDAAEVPDRPSSPSLPRNLVLALLAGLVLSGAATFALEQIDEGLREPSQVNRLLNLPMLGSVPDIEEDDALTQLADSKSILSEAYLSIRSNLAFSTDHGVPRSLMITSTRPAEGKSTTSLATAIVLSRTGKKVLLVDGDMRSPSVHEFAGVANAQGLSNFLAGENDWASLVTRAKSGSFSVLPAGPVPPNAAELLSGDRMNLLMSELVSNFDHVVVDAPPILGIADAPLLSRSVEGCVLVIEAEGVAVRGIKASLERLHAVHARVLGAVLTKLKARQAAYGYGYGYSYGYGQSEEK